MVLGKSEQERGLPPVDLLPIEPQWLKHGQGKDRIQELHPGLPHGESATKYWQHLPLLFPGVSVEIWIRSGEAVTQTGPHM